MVEQQTFVIVGAGLAGAKAAEALRAEGFDGRIVLLGDEPERPYERPPLSKSYLMGTSDKDKLYVHPANWYAQHEVDLQVNRTVTAIDAAAHRVLCDEGPPISYDKLLLATGARPRRLPVPGADPSRVFTLRRLQDCQQLKLAWQSASKVVLVGAGWIGLEVAAAARTAGLDVTVLETAELPLLNVLGRENAAVFADLHRAHGVDLRLGTHIAEVTGADPDRATGVRLADGEVVSGDLVIVGVGVEPNIDLARAAGLITDNGVRVEADLRSSNHDIYAAGDVANAFHPLFGKHIRVEHWANALNQPAVAAKSMLGADAVYDRLPYFYSDQYELGMEYTGYVKPGGYDDVVFRGDKGALEYVTFWLKDGRVLAGMNVNVWDVTADIGTLVRSGRPVDRALLADPTVPLAEVLAAAEPEA